LPQVCQLQSWPGIQAINPELERFMAKRMKAQTTELKTGHAPFISQPEAIAGIIEAAAVAAAK
jgi:hypothetical protein